MGQVVLAITISNPVLVAAAAAALLAGFLLLLYAYNRLVRDSNLVKEAWSGIDVQLRRRHDLIGNLVETVAGYAAHERGVLENVARTRSQSVAAVDLKARQDSENELSLALKNLLAVAEQYPDLKASAGFLELQRELVDVEDQLQMARRYYNGTVRNYNIRAEAFPGNIVANVFGFAAADFFEIENATEREAPAVEGRL